MIKIDKLSKKYDKDYVLKDLSCNIKDNSIYGLVGANGSGKSTLLRTIMGIYEADGGVISVDGEEVYDNEIMKQKMVFVQDDLFFYPGYTLMDTAKWYEAMYKDFDMNYLKELASLLNLKLDKKISTFSKGMKRQALLLIALACKPELLLLDEAFDGLDPIVRVHIKNALSDLIEDNNSLIIISSHNLKELEDICDSYGILENGHIETYGDLLESKANINKYQLAFKEEVDIEMFKGFDVLYKNMEGRIVTLVIKGNREDVSKKLEALNPLILDVLNVNFEELFIYEHTGALNVK